MSEQYDALKLENQLCFPLYACSKEIVKRYKPYLDKIDLTYTQYITMMALWEYGDINVKTLGKYLYLDSGTLTPVLKSLEKKGYVLRKRSENDQRNVVISLTPTGEEIKKEAVKIPAAMGSCVKLAPEQAVQLHSLLHSFLNGLEQGK